MIEFTSEFRKKWTNQIDMRFDTYGYNTDDEHLISECLNEITRLQARVQELEQERRWISVEEWQPKQCGFYVYEDFRSRLDVDYFHTEKPDLSEVNRLFSMPIPQPPESEEE